MDEINVLMTQFQVAIKMAVEAEVPCPTCGTLNTARRYRFHCAGHRA